HLDIGMPQDFFQLHQATATHHEPGREVVPEVMEGEVGDLRPLQCFLPGYPWKDAAGPYKPLVRLWERRQGTIDTVPEGYLTATAGLGDFELDDVAAERHTIPGQAHNLVLTHAFVRCDQYDIGEVLVLGVLTGREESGFLVQLQPPEPSLALT